MKKFLVFLVVLALAAAAWWYWSRPPEDAAAQPEIRLATVARGNLLVYIEATGSVESNLDVDIKCKASGEIVSLPYDVSQRVPRYVEGKNESEALLAALDPVDETRNVQRAQAARDAGQAAFDQAVHAVAIAEEGLRVARLEAEASISSASARADLDQLTLKRQRDLTDRSVGTQNELDVAVAEAAMSQAQLALARARREALKGLELTVAQRKADVELTRARLAGADVDLADARQRLAETKVYSPLEGVITRRDVQIGQIIASGIVNIAGGTTLMTVSDLSRVFVIASVDESDVGRLVETKRLGQEAVITADAYPARTFTGKVVQITPRGVIEGNVVTFAVKIEVLDDDKDLLLPKMTANVKILANRRDGVLLAPVSAVHYDQDRPVVEVMRGGQGRRQPVVLGLSDGSQTEVLGGLAEGEAVLAGSGTATRWTNAEPVPATRPAEGPPDKR